MAFSPLHLTSEARARSQPSPVGFVVYKTALGQETPTTVVFTCTVPFHQCYIFIFMSLLPGEQIGEACEPFENGRP
jgi:hypothetical protein